MLTDTYWQPISSRSCSLPNTTCESCQLRGSHSVHYQLRLLWDSLSSGLPWSTGSRCSIQDGSWRPWCHQQLELWEKVPALDRSRAHQLFLWSQFWLKSDVALENYASLAESRSSFLPSLLALRVGKALRDHLCLNLPSEPLRKPQRLVLTCSNKPHKGEEWSYWASLLMFSCEDECLIEHSFQDFLAPGNVLSCFSDLWKFKLLIFLDPCSCHAENAGLEGLLFSRRTLFDHGQAHQGFCSPVRICMYL